MPRCWLLLLVVMGCGDAEVEPAAPAPQMTGFAVTAGLPCRGDTPPPGFFVEAREALGIDFVHDAYPPPEPQAPPWATFFEDFPAVAIADLDGDDALDLVFAQGNGPVRLHLTGGRGPLLFEPVDLPTMAPSRAILPADIDADGDRDLLIVTRDQPSIFENTGGRFESERPLPLSVEREPSFFSLAIGDIDGDGYLDLFIGTQDELDASHSSTIPGAERLLLGGPDGLTDASARVPVHSPEDRTFLASLVDLDGDGDLDVYESNDIREAGPSRVLRNDGADEAGNLRLVDASEDSGAELYTAGMGLAVGDYDNDGLEDLYVPAMLPDRNALLHNDGDLRFTDLAESAGAYTLEEAHDVAWGALFFDSDADGWLDLYVTHGFKEFADRTLRTNRDEQANVLLRNTGGAFVRAPEAGLGSVAWSRSPAVGDLNRDGFPDLVVGNIDGAPQVYINGCDDRPWLTVRLRGDPPNTDGIGARIRATGGGLTQTRVIRAGGEGLFGASAPEAYLGFPRGTDEVHLEVRWPDGRVDEESVAVRSLVTVYR